MTGGRLGRFVLGAAVVALAIALVRALRGPAAPRFAGHPSVAAGSGGLDRSAVAPSPPPAAPTAPTAPTAPEPKDEPMPELAAPAPPAGELGAPAARQELEAPTPAAGELEAPTPPAGELASGDAPRPTGPVAWVEPVDGGCPDGYPIKGKLKSGIFHQPGGLAYERTKPDRCYPDAAAAEADGLRAAKR
jgi:hypothetical protein